VKKIGFMLMLLIASITVQAQSLENEILNLVNQHRIRKHLEPLAFNKDIEKAAFKHSKDMAKGKVPFGHTGFDERMDDLMKNLKGANAAAENVAYGPETAAGVVEMWLNSPGHKKNIEGKYNLTGIGTSRSKDGTLYFTQIFIRKK
jgi:uncharacterized protein YkwD